MSIHSALSTIILFATLIVGVSAATDVSTSTTRVVDRRRRHTRFDGSTPCLTELSCRGRFTALHDAGVITGYFYSNSDAIVGVIKGCIIKGDNVYYTLGTMEEMTAPVVETKKTRLYCLPEEEAEDLDDMSFSMLLSLSMPSTKASKPFIEAAELNLSLPEEFNSMSLMSMPLGTKASKPNIFIDAAEFSLSMTELSMSIMSIPGGAKASKPGPKTKSIPIKVSAMSMTEMSMPNDMSMTFAADSMSLLLSSVPLLETSQVDMSIPVQLSSSMSISMPSIELSELSMSMIMSSMPDLIQFEAEMDNSTEKGFIENIKDETTGFFGNATDTASGFFQNATDTVVDLFNGGGKNETDKGGVEEDTSAGAVGVVDRTSYILCVAVASVIVMVT